MVDPDLLVSNFERQCQERERLEQLRDMVRRFCELDYWQVCDLTAEDCEWIFKQWGLYD